MTTRVELLISRFGNQIKRVLCAHRYQNIFRLHDNAALGQGLMGDIIDQQWVIGVAEITSERTKNRAHPKPDAHNLANRNG